MKRIISITLTVVMVMATMCMPAMATETTGEKVFSLDFSDYATGGLIKNGVDNASTGITTVISSDNTASTGPVAGEEQTVNGDVIKYLEFGKDELHTKYGDKADFKSTHDYGLVNLDATLMQTLLAGTDDFTIEFWAKPYANYKNAETDKYYATHDSMLYKYGAGSVSATQIEIYDGNSTASSTYNNTYNVETWGTDTVRDKDGNWVFNPGSQYSRTQLNELHNNNDWLHFVITREWRYDDDTKTTGDYYGAVYLDGVNKTKSSTSNSTAKENVVKSDDSKRPFTIGGMVDNSGVASYIFNGAIAEFNIYNYAMDSTEAGNLYGVNSAKYKAERLKNSISLTAPTAGGEISATPGEIELTFDNVAADASLSKITMKDADGNSIKGGIIVEKSADDAKVVTVKYGTPTAGATYTLTIPADFASVNGYTLGTAKTLTYTVGNSGNIVVDYDFTKDPSDDWKFNGTPGTDYVATTYEGVNAVQLKNASTTSWLGFGYKLDKTETRDLKITFNVAGNGDASSRIIRWGDRGTIVDISKMSSFEQYNPDENGFITFTAKLLYDSTDGLYDVYVYDCNGNLLGEDTNKTHGSVTYRKLTVVHSAGSLESTVYTYVSKYTVEVLGSPEVFSHNTDGIEATADAIELVLSDDITGTGVTATLTDTTDNETVEVGGISYDEATRKLSIELPEGALTAGHSYSLTLGGVVSTSGGAMDSANALTFTVAAAAVPETIVSTAITFTDEADATIVALGNQTEVNAAFTLTNNKTSAVTPYIFLVLYDGNNKMVGKALLNTYTIAANGGTQEYTVTLTVPKDTDLTGYKVKCIGLESLESMAPIFDDGYSL